MGNMALHHQSQKRLELAVKMQVFSGLGNLGPTSTILNPTGAQVGAAWSCWAEAGPERSCWPVLTRSRANVAATSDRDGAFGRCWADLKRCKLPQSRALFGNGARANMVPHPKLHQSDRSVRLLPLLTITPRHLRCRRIYHHPEFKNNTAWKEKSFSSTSSQAS